MGNQISFVKAIFIGLFASFLVDVSAWVRIKNAAHIHRTRQNAAAWDDALIKPPFVIDLKSQEMTLGPGIQALHLISSKRLGELAALRPTVTATELIVEELDMKTVTKNWISYCKEMNKPVDIKSYDIRDVIAACMKENTLSQIVDTEESAETVDAIFVTDRELRRVHFDRTKSNMPMTKQDILDSLLSISDEEDVKLEQDPQLDDDTHFQSFQSLDQIEKTIVLGSEYFGPSFKTDRTSTVTVFEGSLESDSTEYITLPELARAWDLRSQYKWGIPIDNEFDPKAALLLLTDKDDEEDAELVDGAIEYIEAQSAVPINPLLTSLDHISDETLREFVREKIKDIDDQDYVFEHGPLSPIAPNVESQFLGVESFMHSKHPLQKRIPANWKDPEQTEWEDSDMYQLVSTMALPGDPITDFTVKVPIWKQIGMKVDEILPGTGRYLDYIVETVDTNQLVLPSVVEWSLRMHSEPSNDGIERFQDVKQSRLARGMLGGETNTSLVADLLEDIKQVNSMNSSNLKLISEEEVDKLTLTDMSLNSMESSRQLLEELESEDTSSPEEEREMARQAATDESASYMDDLMTAIVDLQDQVEVDINHPESKWMKYKTQVEKRLDKFESMPDLNEDDIIDDLHREDESSMSNFDDDDSSSDSIFANNFDNKLAEAEVDFRSLLGDDEYFENRMTNIAEDTLEEIEAWSGSANDVTNAFHPKVLRPAIDFAERVEKFRLNQRQQKVEKEREAILAMSREEDGTLPILPPVPTELEGYSNDVEYMESMKFFREIVRDPEYEQIMDDINGEIQQSWKEFWGKEKSNFIKGLRTNIRVGEQEIEGERSWDDIENRNFFDHFGDIEDDEDDEYAETDRDDDEDDDEDDDFTEAKLADFESLGEDDFRDERIGSENYEDDEDYDEDEDDPFESSEKEIDELVAQDRDHGIHAPNDKYPSRFYPSKIFEKLKESDSFLEQASPSIDSMYAEFESLKADVQGIAETLADFQLPFADLESQDLAYNFDGKRVPEVEQEMINELEYIPWMDVYYWGGNRERWSQGYYDEGAFTIPPAWLLRPEYNDMVGYDVWSNYDRKLFYDWNDDMLDEDVYSAFSVKALKDVTDLYLTSHVERTKQIGTYRSWARYLAAKAKDPSISYPVRQNIPKSMTPDINKGIEYSDEIFELRHGRKLGRKVPPAEKRFENDTFTLATDTITENVIGTIHENYYWKPMQNITHEIEQEKVEILKPLVDYINFMGKLVSTKDDIIIFDYFGPMKHILGLQGSMEYMAKQLYPATKMLRLETERDSDVKGFSNL